MKTTHLHKTLGLILLTPLLLWAVTGFIFLTKPGYSDAYERLTPKRYPFDKTVVFDGTTSWDEARLLKTIIGYHLIVLSEGQWQHLDPFTLAVKPQASKAHIQALVADATTINSVRYGNITAIINNEIHTDTGVVISLDWKTLSLQQTGTDTRLINTLYRIHYLQWLSSAGINKVLGILGLLALTLLSILGLLSYLKRR